ncbi:MAG: AsmA family protein [Bauldia sp.]
MTSASATAPVRRPILRRVVLVLLGVVLAVAGVLAVAPALVPTETVSTRIAEQIEQWLGRPVTFAGDPVISLYPRPTVTIRNVVIGAASGGDEPLITVERVIGTVALLPLLLGRVEISEFSLLRPVINLRTAADGRSNWVVEEGTIGARLAEARDDDPTDDAAADVTLGRFLIEDGTVTFRRGDGPLSEITAMSVDISWPSTAGGMTASGRLTWRGEPIEITGYLGRPLDLFGGRSSPARFTAASGPAALFFDGTVDRNELDFSLAGTTSLTTPSLRRLLAWAGARLPIDGETPGAAAISGEATWSWPVLAFASGTMSLDGSSAAGSFSVDFSQARPFLRGTLAATVVDLSPYAVSLRTGVEPDGTWIGAPIDVPAFAAVDADLRLSAEEVRMGVARLTAVAASATVASGRFLLSLEEATFYGGSLRASLNGAIRADTLTLHATAAVAGMAVLPALEAIAGVSVLAGTVDGRIDAGGTGSTWSELARNLTGTITATIGDGALRGIDLARAATLPLPAVADLGLGNGATAFDLFEGDFALEDGLLIARSFTAEGAGYTLSFAGGASLLRPEVGGSGTIVFAPATERPVLVPFTLAGTWAMPVLADAGTPAAPPVPVAAPSSP